MEKLNPAEHLTLSIKQLEQQQSEEWQLIKGELMSTYEQMKPLNILKNSIQQAISSPTLKNDIINTALGLAAGYLSKKLVVGETNNPIKNIFGSFLQVVISSLVSINPELAQSISDKIVGFFGKTESPTNTKSTSNGAYSEPNPEQKVTQDTTFGDNGTTEDPTDSANPSTGHI